MITPTKGIRLKETLYLRLKALARKEGKQIGFLLDRAVSNYLKLRKA